MAYYGSLGDIDVGAISSTKSETAVDVFVYDTRKDSDGGAWRKRTQHTSWYNETLNTATRGSRRDFPAVAVLVLTSSTLTIYDGDDPDMPMWMVFQFNGNSAIRSLITATATFALNGRLSACGQEAGGLSYNSGISIVSFIDEKAIWKTNAHSGIFGLPLSSRNTNGGYGNTAGTSDDGGPKILSRDCNDVAMTVLPNAPIDPSTGLPVPTIAVATSGGVSVIRDNGTVESTDIANIVRLGFVKNDRLAYGHRAGYAYQGIALDIAPFRNSATYGWYINQTTPSFGGYTITDSAGAVQGLGDENVYAWGGSTGGIRRISENISSPTNGMVNYITTSYNTGWMHGDIKGAWLSDTSTASVTGTELITNGNFSGSDLSSYFQVNNCSLAVVSNQLVMTSNTGNYYCEFYVSITDTSKPHYLSFQFVGASNLSQFGIYASPATGYVTDTQAGWSNPSYVTDRSTGIYTILIPAGNSMVGFVFPSPAVYTWTFDNISLKPVQESDRSVNNRGLAVYGTLTKTAVATGSNLVAYGGFSSSNYLLQTYNSALNFGTGPFSMTIWCKSPAGAGTYVLYSWRGSSGTLPFWQTYFGDNLTVFDIQDSSSNNGGFSINRSLKDNVWHLLTVVQRNSSLREFYIDGILVGTNTTTIGSLTSTAHELRVGTHFDGLYAYNGSLALFRVSATAPSPEQILKIYNDEKALFQPNSQCTLYGSSDAVTALAYDETTNLLHVGTASGRSDFSGLKRINNTTTSVTTAISASNGLIAEQ